MKIDNGSKFHTISLPFGDSEIHGRLPAISHFQIIEPQPIIVSSNEHSIIEQALSQPYNSPKLRHLVKANQKVVIITSDITRPCPSDKLLPPVLDELKAAGVQNENVTIVIGLGLHRPMTHQEREKALSAEICSLVQVLNHDPGDTVYLGTTSRGTPVEIFRPVVEADFRICLGNLEFHYFAGYTGGSKAIIPGCASQKCITANHAMMLQKGASSGILKGNPVRVDLEEAAAMMGIDFILNVVVDGEHRIQAAFAGDTTAAHRQGAAFVAQCGIVKISQQVDVVLVSAGGFPKDINLYQAQKALQNGSYAVRDGGTIILVAECREGFGNQIFESWMAKATLPDKLLAAIQKEFVLGGHKAAAIAAILKRATIHLVSSMPAKTVRSCNLVPYRNLSQVLKNVAQRSGFQHYHMIVMPQGGSTLPVINRV